MKARIKKHLAWLIDQLLCLFVSFITGVRPKRAAALPFGTQHKVYYANHGSHGDFVLVWISLPRRWRIHTRPVAGADYWLTGRFKRFIIQNVFNALLIARNSDNPREITEQMRVSLEAGDSLIIFPEGTRNTDDNTVLLPPAHAVIDADDHALSVFRTTHRQPGTQRKMVAGSGKFLLVETLAGSRAPAMKLAAIKTGQTFAYSLHTLRQGDVCRCWGSQQQRRCQPADQHPEPGQTGRGFSEPVSALRHPGGPESDRGDTPSRPVPAIPPSPARHPPLRPPAPGRYHS